MVGVSVRNKNGVNISIIEAEFAEALPYVRSDGQVAGVYKDAGGTGGYEGAVAGARACQNANARFGAGRFAARGRFISCRFSIHSAIFRLSGINLLQKKPL